MITTEQAGFNKRMDELGQRMSSPQGRQEILIVSAAVVLVANLPRIARAVGSIGEKMRTRYGAHANPRRG